MREADAKGQKMGARQGPGPDGSSVVTGCCCVHKWLSTGLRVRRGGGRRARGAGKSPPCICLPESVSGKVPVN